MQCLAPAVVVNIIGKSYSSKRPVARLYSVS